MNILLTGFSPFGGEIINPSFEAIKLMPNIINNHNIIKIELPTSFKKSTLLLEECILKYSPDIIIATGQAGGRTGISFEKVAINLMEAGIPDNDGYKPTDLTIKTDGDTAYFSNLPIKSMAQKVINAGIPASISYSAGTYVCNSVMYNIMYLIDKKYPKIKGGFIHVPYIKEQTIQKPNLFSMELATIAKGLTFAIEGIFKDTQTDTNFGKTM